MKQKDSITITIQGKLLKKLIKDAQKKGMDNEISYYIRMKLAKGYDLKPTEI